MKSLFRLAALVAAPALLALAPAARADVAASAGDCAWPTKADADRVNIAYPDKAAQYWLSSYAAAPGTELRIRGTFPHARYMSFHAYEGSIPVDHASDAEIEPDAGVNPFRAGADRRRPGRYTVHVVPEAPPADPAQRQPNTIYAGRGTQGEPLPAVTIVYRVYLGERDITGGVGLPQVDEVVHTGGEERTTPPLPTCQANLASASLGLNTLVAGESAPSAPGPSDAGAKPKWGVSRSGGSVREVGPVNAQAGNPFFPNYDNTYLSLLVNRRQGDVVAFRAKAPTFVRSRGVRRQGRGQLRYWSFCTNELGSTRYIDCIADEDAKIDRRGYVNVVVSDPAHRPRNLAARDNWLPWGPAADVFVLYRHMLPAPGFKHAVQRIPADGDPRKAMGAYHPATAVCTTERFERDRCGVPRPVTAKRRRAR